VSEDAPSGEQQQGHEKRTHKAPSANYEWGIVNGECGKWSFAEFRIPHSAFMIRANAPSVA
ncbi:MAG: hypothetical protein ACREXT_04750, partial [Gammaproteobacteria bacterium]